MPIVQASSLNTTALVVPDIYVQIVPPQNLTLNGVPTNVVGVVGTASWGPVGEPVIIGNASMYFQAFGPVRPARYDMGTQVSTAIQQGADDFRCVRVTDGTDAAATGGFWTGTAGVSGTQNLAIFARYTGTMGNQVGLSLAAGSRSGTWQVVVSFPGRQPEVFDNIPGPTGTTSADYQAFWGRVRAAINTGSGNLRGPSQAVFAGAGDATTFGPPVATTALMLLSGGTDGGAVSATHIIGQDVPSRAGMYALREQGCSIGVLADLTDTAQWTVAAQFGLDQGMYMILCGPSGDTIQAAIAAKQAAGLDTYAVKLMFGDWVYWQDQFNAVLRLVSPQGFVAGRLANLSPEQSPLNKPLYGVSATQRSGLPGTGRATTYTTAELAALLKNGIDVIANPQPGGGYYGVRGGYNASSSPDVRQDTYTRMTNYLAATIAAGMGRYVGQVINDELFRRQRATVLSFLGTLLQQGLLGRLGGDLPYAVKCDVGNNPFDRTKLGYTQVDVQVRYQAINEKLIVNLEGGQTVQVSRQLLPNGQQ